MEILSAAATKLDVDPAEREIRIVATMGPAWESQEMLTKMVSAGVNVIRLNCSHRFENAFETLYPLIRSIAKSTGKNVEVLGDLQGPKFRTMDCRSDVIVKPGDIVTLALATNDEDIVRVTEHGARITMAPTVEQTALVNGLTVGMELLMEDGRRKIQVRERVSASEVKATVLVGGTLKARQGVNVPDLEIGCAALTEKDLKDAEFLLGLDPPIDYIAMSFVQKAADLQELVDLMDRLGIPAERRPKICPKIEKPQALTNLDGILEKCQALMVARGDLGVEIGLERVPLAQKVMVQKAKAKGLFPVIVATQMMESMIHVPVPQRSEISDVANAVFDGADAVMLSSEAAMGRWPVETVKAMASAALHAQKRKHYIESPLKALPPMTTVLAPVPPPEARKTKILATLGPASKSPEMILKLVAAGVDMFRLNCTYRQPGEFEAILKHVNSASKVVGRKIEVIADLQGPKFRISDVFWTGVQLEEGMTVSLSLATSDGDICRPGGAGIKITMKPTVAQTAFLLALEVGTVVFIEEGKQRLKVMRRVSPSEVLAEVLSGGRLTAQAVIESPGLNIDCPALTEKDVDDATFLLGLDPPVDYIALSFVQKGTDLLDLIALMDSLGVPTARRPRLCPRIERPQALRNLEAILEKSDGVIVARGELGFELGIEGVPFAQKVMMHRAKAKGLFPVMVSTQLMESMIKNATPTRAEANDVVNAVFDGGDVIMLSGETAKGNYPVESVMAMAAFARVADAQKALVTPAFGCVPAGAGSSGTATLAPVAAESGHSTAGAVSDSAGTPVSLKGRIVVMMGPPASGKGTQCKRLAKESGVVHLSVGDIIRDEIKRGTELGAKVNVYMSRGDMVSDELTLQIVGDRLAKEDVLQHGCLLDGFPRTDVQAVGLARSSINIDRFVLFDLPDEDVVGRALGRLNDPETGEIYHLKSAPPPPEVVSRLMRRDNDKSEEVVRTRLKFYHAHLAGILQAFRHKLQVVDARPSPDDVARALRQCLASTLEVRRDAADGEVCSFDGLKSKYQDSRTPQDIMKHWEEMEP